MWAVEAQLSGNKVADIVSTYNYFVKCEGFENISALAASTQLAENRPVTERTLYRKLLLLKNAMLKKV